jgi:hypothetical protein
MHIRLLTVTHVLPFQDNRIYVKNGSTLHSLCRFIPENIDDGMSRMSEKMVTVDSGDYELSLEPTTPLYSTRLRNPFKFATVLTQYVY